MLQFDFSTVQVGTLAEIERNFWENVKGAVECFTVKYGKLADWSKVGSPKSAMLVEFKYFTNATAEKGKVFGRATPDAETVEQALAYRKALAHRPDWNHPIAVAVVEVCGNAGCNWFDLPPES